MNYTAAQQPDGSTDFLEAITFAAAPNVWYVPLRQAADRLGWDIAWKSGRVYLRGQEVGDDAVRLKALLDGTRLVAVRDLAALGANVTWDSASGFTTVSAGDRTFEVRYGPQRVEIDRTHQVLHAWQGDFLVLQTPVSTGRAGHRTPTGTFSAGPYKAPMHYSRLYDDAPMPWSVQVNGNVFCHGFSSVPDRPASHGCIRMPLTEGNPAQRFYEWINIGTPVTISGRWSD